MNIYPKHPDADAYALNGGTVYTPYAYVAREKRFTDAELAAEYWQAQERCMFVSAFSRMPISSDSKTAREASTIHRFATLPHFDDQEPA